MTEQTAVRNPDDQGLESGHEIVTVFIRKGKDEDTRLFSFNKPTQAADEIQADVLNARFAFDGHSIVYLVTPFTKVAYHYAEEGKLAFRFLFEDVEARPLQQVLNEAQIMIRDWLSEKGLLVYFA